MVHEASQRVKFPYFFVGTFIEATLRLRLEHESVAISLLFRRDFH